MFHKRNGFIALALLVIIAILASCTVSASAHEKAAPLVTSERVAEIMDCKPHTVQVTYLYEHWDAYESISCKTRDGQKVTARNFISVEEQTRDIARMNSDVLLHNEEPFWILRCGGFNAWQDDFRYDERAYAKRFKQYLDANCNIVRINGVA